MSMELMVKVMAMKVGNPVRKLVLLKLADNASDQGECWPSYQYIADQCEVSKRTVITHIDGLISGGLLRKETRKGPKGNSSNVYFINLGGEGYSLGQPEEVVQEIHPPSEAISPPSEAISPPSEAISPPSESPALGGGEGDSPRTSHSLEPVIEPIKESKPKKPTKPKSSLRTRLIEHYSSSIPESSIDDALEHRRAKGVANTERGHTMFFNEVLQCSQELRIAPSTVIDIVIQRDWKGVNTEWVRGHLRQARPTAPVIQNQPMITQPNNRQAVSDSITNIHDTDW